jgi:hypothetical protein
MRTKPLIFPSNETDPSLHTLIHFISIDTAIFIRIKVFRKVYVFTIYVVKIES